MNANVMVYRRRGIVLVTSSSETEDGWWRTNDRRTVFPDSLTDEQLGTAIHTELLYAAAQHPETRSTPAEWKLIAKAQNKAMGARSERDFARDNDAVRIRVMDDVLLVAGLVSDVATGGFGTYGGNIETTWPQPPLELARLCREAWERGGVAQNPEAAEPHT